MKPSVLDHLDKSEPPSDIPTMYPVYLVYQILVSLSQGVANYVYNLNDDSKSPNVLEADVELANALVEKATPDVSVMYEMLIYTSMDDETFFALIKSFQKIIHAAGLLGLNEQRDQLLLILCKATIKNTSDKSEHQPAEGTSFQEQKKQLLAFGEQLVESISSTIAGETNDTDSISSGKPHVSTPPALHSRYFNSRHVVCLRVLSNTAITLKSTLQDFWSVIWITFQWCDYYLNGPDAFSGFHNHKSYQGFTDAMRPQISAQDVNHIDSALSKLVESISDSSVEVFHGSLSTLSHLTDVAYTPTSESTTLDVSPYNKTYFMSKVVELCEDDIHQWLIKDDESWNLMSKYFVDGATKRTLSSGLRSSVIEKYTHVIESVAVAGFKHEELIDQTSARTLNGMSRYLEQISEMGSPQEVLIANCETEIHLSILTTLHNLIDKYDKNYQQSWHEVFKILNTPFKVSITDSVAVTDDGNTRGKLIEKSFDSLKLILDEFLSTLPFTQFKLLIDTLAKFVYQKHDLNISFTSVSYFWSISDALKSRMTLFNSEKGRIMPTVESEEELVNVIEQRQESYTSYICLDVYLLLSLSKISRDEVNRAQVRDGAIQTFFQIIDVHGNLLEKSWGMVYKIVLSNFFSIVPESRTTDWIESLQLVLSGFISLYNKYLMNDEVDGIVDKWEQLLGYIEKLLHLQWIDLNLQVFKSLQDLMIPFDMHNKDIRHLFFKIWSEFPIEYDLVNANYQESLVQFMKCFPPLYRIIEKEISVSEVDTVVGLFNKCGMYPILPNNASDTVKPTNLQNSILENLKIINSDDPNVQSLVIQQLSNIIVYPYGIRSRIEKKLSNNKLVKYKLPSFVAVSHVALDLLVTKFDAVTDFAQLVNDNGVSKCLRALLEIMESKAEGVPGKSSPVWIEATNLLITIVGRLVDQPNVGDNDDDDELWRLVVQSVELCIKSDDKDQDVNIKHYNQLIGLVLPKLLERDDNNTQLLDGFVSQIYEHSYLYKPNDLESRLMASDSNQDVVDNLTSYKFDEYFGTTERLEKYSNLRIRLNNLQELIKFVHHTDSKLHLVSETYLLLRASFTLRRLINDVRLVYKCPLPIIQQRELMMLLNGINDMESVSELNRPEFKKLYRLLIQLIPYSSRIIGLDGVLPKVLIKIST
ncbi:MON2 Protein MON2 [Candida maltosa Xu316]